ncbi:hypothetical protein MM326_13730 [Alkalihalobacillus sp. LMS6]|jgi:hypothetical protein|uniref:hypothetical protein n=1 Tax=Alkalihalobacillus sp. LMS6 TaxID=2924034 RepID=UPI0020D069F2|nr:hypothetical protein [Alkalihalobacillus sp. LMS6]UTR05168.1 hypothetical protein MM326_13730 [Alkalihalobacillus sp. LMS6]
METNIIKAVRSLVEKEVKLSKIEDAVKRGGSSDVIMAEIKEILEITRTKRQLFLDDSCDEISYQNGKEIVAFESIKDLYSFRSNESKTSFGYDRNYRSINVEDETIVGKTEKRGVPALLLKIKDNYID